MLDRHKWRIHKNTFEYQQAMKVEGFYFVKSFYVVPYGDGYFDYLAEQPNVFLRGIDGYCMRAMDRVCCE
jgi:hypothetical protein